MFGSKEFIKVCIEQIVKTVNKNIDDKEEQITVFKAIYRVARYW